MKPKSVSNLRRIARALATAEKFVAIELHPAVYVSIIAINLCLVFAYREFSGANAEHHQHRSPAVTASSPADVTPGQALLASNTKSISQAALPSAFRLHKIEKQVAASEEAPAVPTVASVPLPIKSSGAVLAAVTEKPVRKKKKSRKASYSNGLVPPPPPGVDIVPPPPDAPSLFIGGIKGGSFLVPPPPPMVLASNSSTYDWPQSSATSTRRSHKSSHHNNDRARTVTHGNYKRIIVSR